MVIRKSRSRNKKLKYRYTLITIILIIIALLVTIIIKINNKTKNSSDKDSSDLVQEENVIVVDLEEQRIKEEERKKEQELKEIEEEKNATGVIYLTFDDGPSHDSTPAILDILAKKGIKATFFVLNYNENNEELIKREFNDGHTIGLHGYTHAYSEAYQSVESCMENYRKIQDKVYQTIGIKSNIMRFLGGSSNTVSRKYCQGLMTEVTKKVIEEGFRYYDWNVDSTDATKPKSSEIVYNKATEGLKPNRDNVVLMHDFAGNDKTVDVLERVIDYGLQNGYVFRRITERVPMVHHNVNN